MPRGIALLAIVLLSLLLSLEAKSADWSVRATGHDSRIDLVWDTYSDCDAYRVERRVEPNGEFEAVPRPRRETPAHSEFFGSNNVSRSYRVIALRKGENVATSLVVSATSRTMSDQELLSSVQEATFRYFWDYAHPVSGLARERTGVAETVTSGGSGFGLMALVVGAERGLVARSEVANRVRIILHFLSERAQRFHGAWSHWLNGTTGRVIPFSRYDDGADLVETSYLVQGLLTVRQYFDRAEEEDIRDLATSLWEGVEWDWFLREPNGQKLYWHWSTRYGWKMDHPVGGHFNECMITYLLAMASPTHPIPASCYLTGWVGEPPTNYINGQIYYGQRLWVGMPYGGPLFFTHYSFLGFDPRGKSDFFCNYFENSRAIAIIQQGYCSENPKGHSGYSALVWGLSASDDPDGYAAHDPRFDNGTITPTAAISSIVYVPEAALATLRHFYHHYGDRLWGEFGFKDAFNLDRNWFAESYLAIDQGPIVIMIENYRSGLCWRLFMANKEIRPALKAAGWRWE